MSWRAVRDRVHALLLSEPVWRLLPTLGTLYLNRYRVREPVRLPDLPQNEWSRSQRHDLLTFSEERMRNIEAKGPGLATVSAVIVAAVLLAIIGGWDESTAVARPILVLTALYSAFSLLMPLYLVGPLKRDTVHIRSIETAARADDPEEVLAHFAAEGAMRNDLRNLRLANLLDAARRELAYALALLLLWVVLVPVTGLMRKDDTAMRPHSAVTSQSHPSGPPYADRRHGQPREFGESPARSRRSHARGARQPVAGSTAVAAHPSRASSGIPSVA